MTSSRMRFMTGLAASTFAVGTAVGGATSATAADVVDCAGFSAEVTQLVRPTTDANLITKWPSEADAAQTLYGFTDDLGVVGKVSVSAGAGLVPIWRMYRGGDFVWAAAGADVTAFEGEGYQRQFIDFYASGVPQSCLGAVNRLERDGVHRVAVSADVAGLVKQGWVDDGPGFYAVTTVGPVEPPEPPVPPSPPLPPPPAGTDTKFSIAVVPDTQNETASLTGTRFANRVDWLVDHKAELDLRYAIQIGDLTSWGNVVPAQFAKASTEIKPLEAVIPWSVAAGNHDTAAVCLGGSACPGANSLLTVRDVSAFNSYFPPTRFPAMRGTFEPNRSENSYATFSAGGKKWLVLTLELWARPSVVAWANGVVKANPDSNVIVNTHSYLNSDGSISESNGGYGSTSPRYLFDNLIKVHPNIVLVVSGHTGQGAIRTDVGGSGNKVVSLLQAFHSSTNPVRLVEIDTSARTLTSRVYAPETDTDYPAYTTSTTGLSFR